MIIMILAICSQSFLGLTLNQKRGCLALYDENFNIDRTQHCRQVVSSVKISISQFLGKNFTGTRSFFGNIYLKPQRITRKLAFLNLPGKAIFMLYIELFCFMVTRSTGNEIQHFFNISFLVFLLSSTVCIWSLFIACVFLASFLYICSAFLSDSTFDACADCCRKSRQEIENRSSLISSSPYRRQSYRLRGSQGIL